MAHLLDVIILICNLLIKRTVNVNNELFYKINRKAGWYKCNQIANRLTVKAEENKEVFLVFNLQADLLQMMMMMMMMLNWV